MPRFTQKAKSLNPRFHTSTICRYSSSFSSDNNGLTLGQRSLLTPYFAISSVINPHRGDYVAGLGDITAESALRRLQSHVRGTAKGRKLLLDQPVISSSTIDMNKLKKLSEDTFGWKYYEFMTVHQFEADERSPVRFIADPELAYIMTRYRQVHDFWHVLCGLPISILGEIALKWFEWWITRLPVCFLSGTAGQVRLSAIERRVLHNQLLPWAYRSAIRSKDVLIFRYEDHLEMPLHQVRSLVNIEPAPQLILPNQPR